METDTIVAPLSFMQPLRFLAQVDPFKSRKYYRVQATQPYRKKTEIDPKNDQINQPVDTSSKK
jgi:hypothetical protein